MHEAFADRICGGMDGALREQPFGPGMVVWTIDGRMFAAYTEAGEGLSLRVPEDDVQGLTRAGLAGAHDGVARAGWVVISWQTRPEVLRVRIAESYRLVLADRNVDFCAE